jgi:FtsH-binding integral membrane protein
MERITAFQRADVRVNEFVRSVYNWMCMGLAVTGLMAWYVSGNETLMGMVFGETGVKPLFFILVIAELALVFSISGMVNKMSGATATARLLSIQG